MNIQCGSRDATSLRRQPFVVSIELLEFLEYIFRDREALFEPSFFFAVSADPEEALLPFEHLEAVSTFDRADLVIDGGNTVAKIGLRNRNVDIFAGADGPATAAQVADHGKKNEENGTDRRRAPDTRATDFPEIHGSRKLYRNGRFGHTFRGKAQIELPHSSQKTA